MGRWERLVRCSREPENSIHIAMVGKYVGIGDFQLTDSYISQSVHTGVAWDTKVEIWIDGHQFETGDIKLSELDRFDGLIVPGAFGSGGSGRYSGHQLRAEDSCLFSGYAMVCSWPS